mgnify:CR=1 FL=1
MPQDPPPEADPARAALAERLRPVLAATAARGGTILYRDLAQAAGVPAPHSIHKTTLALETLARADHAAGRPLLAAVAVGKAGLPGPGFFQLLADLGRHDGPDRGPVAEARHRAELAAVHAAYAPGTP